MISDDHSTTKDIKYWKKNGHLFGLDIEELDREQFRRKRRMLIDNIFNSINGGRSVIKKFPPLLETPPPPPPPPSPELSQSTEQMDEMDELLKYFESSEDMKLDLDNILSADSTESDENSLNEFLEEIDELTRM